jgi:hypothetical protein
MKVYLVDFKTADLKNRVSINQTIYLKNLPIYENNKEN